MCVDQGIAYMPSEQLDTWTGLDILICQKKKKTHYTTSWLLRERKKNIKINNIEATKVEKCVVT